MTALIRPVRATDAPALAALAAITWPLAAPDDTDPQAIAAFVEQVLSAERFAEYVGDLRRIVLLAEDGDDPIGYAMLVAEEPVDPAVAAVVATRPTIALDKFYVHPDHHGDGTAASLMAAAIDSARGTGARSVWLGVNVQNGRARRFYDKCGFDVVGTRRFRVGDRLENDFVLELDL